MIKQKTEEDLKKFPWLGDVPVLGMFFRHKETKLGGGSGKRGDTELFITLTPHIISMPEESRSENSQKQNVLGSTNKETFNFYEKKDVADSLKEYVRSIQRRITSNISYPSVLDQTGWEASLVLNIKLSSAGELKEAKIVKPSGYKIFDKEALSTVKKLKSPPFPPRVKLKEINIEIPITYRSER